MNIDRNSDPTQNKVTSKYFTKEPMDESLSDFQETKRSHTGPKTSKTNTKKPRKAPKRPKGQKDIRTALIPKKNDLITYTETFDAICKKSGIDVDTEDLQLAIALSKSLETEVPESNYKTEVSSQERIKKIRTTLQEYGFKVPETKISTNIKRRKHKKSYQLISKSNIEKEQIISDKYSQVLLTNINDLNNSDDLEVASESLFYKTTNISFKDIKNQDIFYCIELVEQSTSNGCLLKDWAKIPGRPASPVLLKDIGMNFSEIECSQEELDIILSGPFIKSKNVIKVKQMDVEKLHKNNCKILNSKENIELISNKEIPSIIIEKEASTKLITFQNKESCGVKYRSCSPDIFDDESVIEVITTNPTIQETNNDIMDLTECVNNMPLRNNTFVSKCNYNLSQKSNVTRRKSDDFMEITDCVASTSQLFQVNVDPTQISEKRRNGREKVMNEVIVLDKKEDMLDLTQSSDSGSDLPEVYLNHKKNLDDTVPLNFSDYEGVLINSLNSSHKVNAVYDLTQVENKVNKAVCNSVVEVLENNKPNISGKIRLDEDLETHETHLTRSSKTSDKTNIVAQNISTENCKIWDVLNLSPASLNEEQMSGNNATTDLKINENLSDDNVDLTQASNASDETVIIDQNNTNSGINNEHTTKENSHLEILHCSLGKSNTDQIQDHNVRTDIKLSEDLPGDNVDLTQSSNSSIKNYSNLEHSLDQSNDSDKTVILHLNDNCEEIAKLQNDHANLGKKDNISIDYDQLSIINDANEFYAGNTSHIKYYKGKNKIDDSNLSPHPEFFKNNNTNDCDKTVILPLHNDKCEVLTPNHILGEKVNSSIDYDDVYVINDDENQGIENNSRTFQSRKNNTDNSHSSQDTEFQIVDNELNYSLHKSKRENFDLGGISILNSISNNPSFRKSTVQTISNFDDSLPPVEVKDDDKVIIVERTPEKKNNLNKNAVTPENDYIIKVDNVTPMPNYEAMSTPERNKELDKYGLKPFKRKRAIQLLTHIYNQTHPVIESLEDLPTPAKRFKRNTPPSIRRQLLPSPKQALEMLESQDVYEVTNEVPVLKEIVCEPEDWVFQKREKAKVHSCRVPLHIAFHNYVSCRLRLREAILRYEPVDIDVIHKQLVGYGHRYDPKELLKFMDKKCITVKTTEK